MDCRSTELVPTVVEPTPRGDRSTDLFSRLLGERIIFVGTPIDDAMWHVTPDVATLCVGQATATAEILCAADAAGKRAILPHGRVRLVQPHVASSHGSISDLAVEATEVARMRTQTEAILARHTDKRAEDIRADTDHALVLAGQAAVDYGLVTASLWLTDPAPV